MEGYKVVRSFYHDKMWNQGEDIDLGQFVNKELEKLGLIRYVFRPNIIMPKPKEVVTPKKKKNVRKGKKNL